MKKLLVVNLIFAFSQCFAQSVNFLLSYELAVQKSKENKLPCLVIIAPEVNCKDCPKINFKRKFESKGLREIFSGYNIYISRDMETEGSKLLVKFGLPPRLPLFVFLSEAEEVLHYASGWSDDDSFFARMDQEVKDRNKKGSYYFYLKNYSSKKTDRLFLREMIELQSSRNMLVADSVLSDYSKTFSDEELQLLENRTYIISKGLVFESELYKKIVPNSDFRQIFASMPIGERANTNSKIIQKTIFAAIKKRDTALAYMGSRFAERTWSANPKRGYLAYVSNMRSFYGGIRDTANFLNKTGELAEKYLVEDLKDSTLTPTQKDLKAMELNNVAFSVCQWTNKKEWLKKAADWSKKSLEVNRIAELLDTFAQLQYKLGNKEMAIDFQQEAIENARKSNKNTLRYQSTLERMKSGTLK